MGWWRAREDDIKLPREFNFNVWIMKMRYLFTGMGVIMPALNMVLNDQNEKELLDVRAAIK